MEDLQQANLAGSVRSIRLEIADSVRVSGSEIAANMAAMMPVLEPSKKLELAIAAQRMMEAEFKMTAVNGEPSLQELLAIELYFDTCLQVTKSLIGIKKTKLGIKAKNDVIQGAIEGKERERKVAAKKSIDKIVVKSVSGEKQFAHTALDMVKDVFYVSSALGSNESKLMKKLCDRILVMSALDELEAPAIKALFNKDLFKPLVKFVTFK